MRETMAEKRGCSSGGEDQTCLFAGLVIRGLLMLLQYFQEVLLVGDE